MTASPPDSVRFFIALMLPPKVDAYANSVIAELRQRYRTRTAKAAPHITLQPPFLWPTDSHSVDRLTREISAVAAQHGPVPVRLDGFNAFRPRVLYIDVDKTDALLALQADVARHLKTQLNIVDAKAKSRAFSPHVTVASRNLSPGLFRRIWADLRSRPAEFEFVCDRLTLLIYNGQWHTHSEYELGG